MLRSKNFKSTEKFYHLNFEYFATGLFKELDWEFVLFQLGQLSVTYKIQVHAVVMMDTHIHLLFQTSCTNENFFTNQLVQKISPQVEAQPLLEPIYNLSQYLNTYKYIFRNPVEAGLCKTTEQYPYSSLQIILGLKKSSLLIQDSLNLIIDGPRKLKWLNTKNENYKSVSFKAVFQNNSFFM